MAEILTDRRQEIREVAQNLFREKGYAGTSMRDIARSMGIEAASLYNHIRSKEEILQQICFSIADEFVEEIRSIDSSLQAEEQLKEAIGKHLHVILRNIDASHVFFHEWVYMNSESLRRFKSLRSNYEKRFREILQSGMDSGIFSSRDLKLSVFTLFAAMNALHELQHHLRGQEEGEIVETLTDILMNGIKQKK